MSVDYKFNEGAIINEIKEYIDATYDGHYSKNKFQSTEFIVDCGHGDGFCLGNIIKYAQRYGKKEGKNKKDLQKIIHYAIIALSILETESETEMMSSADMVHINVLKKEIEVLKSRLMPHDTGHLHTTINVLEHRVKEIEDKNQLPYYRKGYDDEN